MIKTETKISCIIPALNEEDNISKVLDVLQKIKWLDEIIVVDDGSTDQTALVVLSYKSRKIRLIQLEQNLGKGGAMAEGVRAARNDLLVFLDADLIGLNEDHLLELISPVAFSKTADLTLGVFAISKLNKNAGTKIANRAVPWISGQRAIYKKQLPRLKQLAKSRYGVDLLITRSISKNRIKVVKLDGLSQDSKEQKTDFFTAIRSRVKMYYQISKMFRAFHRSKT